ncbi:hypothetical protein [Thiorhodospira sibirica]|nr:hypothetical protein [Thiorhodospira sibirica]
MKKDNARTPHLAVATGYAKNAALFLAVAQIRCMAIRVRIL